MDDQRNPFDPFGTSPGFLAGRAAELAAIDALVQQLAGGGAGVPLVLAGRAGSGTSSLASSVPARVAPHDWHAGVACVEADEPVRDTIGRAFAAALTSFASRRPGSHAVGVAADAIAAFAPRAAALLPAEPSAAAIDERRGDLARDLRRLLGRVADGLRELVGRGLLVVVDDLERADPAEAVAALSTFGDAMRDGRPVGLVAAGTPTVRWCAHQAGVVEGVIDVGPLDTDAVAALLRTVTARAGAGIDDAAIAAVCSATAGYPQLVQLFAAAAWQVADGPIITAADVVAATAGARDQLARRVLGPAFAVDAAARRYLRAVAEADDPADSGLVARKLGDTTRFGSGASQLTELRDRLVRRGLLANLDGVHVAFAHPAARSYVLSWDQR